MRIVLKFDYDESVVYVPDGYVKDLNELQVQFLDWVNSQSDCLEENGKMYVLSYDATDFLRYINDVVLKYSKEKAYLFSEDISKMSKKASVIKF